MKNLVIFEQIIKKMMNTSTKKDGTYESNDNRKIELKIYPGRYSKLEGEN
jgi:hypothetical protein